MCNTERTRSYLPLLKQHDTQAQNDFTLEFQDCAYGATYSQFHPDERIECVYDAFMKIFAEAPGLRDLTGSYVHTAVRNQCRNVWLRQERAPKHVPLPADLPSEPEQPMDEWAKALDILDPAERKVVELRTLDGRTWKEVAKIMEISVSKARRILAEALEKLRRWYEKHAE